MRKSPQKKNGSKLGAPNKTVDTTNTAMEIRGGVRLHIVWFCLMPNAKIFATKFLQAIKEREKKFLKTLFLNSR